MASIYEHAPSMLRPDLSTKNFIKVEKFSHFESFNLNNSRCVDISRTLGPKLHTVKSKIRVTTQSRGDYQSMLDFKTPSQKLFIEPGFPATSKIPFLPLLSIRTNAIEECFKEIRELNLNLTELIEKNKINTQCIQVNKLKLASLEDCQEKLKIKAGLGPLSEKKKENLQAKLKGLQAEWGQSTEILKKKIQELEQEARLYTSREDTMKGIIYRQGKLKNNPKKLSGENSKSFEFFNLKTRILELSPSVTNHFN